MRGLSSIRNLNLIKFVSPILSHRYSSILEADTGVFGSHTYHKVNKLLAVFTPLYFFTPISVIPLDSPSDKLIGVSIATAISAHSWVGMNYVISDYVPKISKTLVGPARVVASGIATLTLLGLAKVAMNNKGGLRATILALWWTNKNEFQKEGN